MAERAVRHPQFKVGIAWQGNPRFSGDYYRSVRLEQFAPIAACRNVKLFSLQKNFGREQLVDVGSRMSIVDLGAVLDEDTGPFIDTVAVMMNLDLVITTDTAVATSPDAWRAGLGRIAVFAQLALDAPAGRQSLVPDDAIVSSARFRRLGWCIRQHCIPTGVNFVGDETLSVQPVARPL